MGQFDHFCCKICFRPLDTKGQNLQVNMVQETGTFIVILWLNLSQRQRQTEIGTAICVRHSSSEVPRKSEHIIKVSVMFYTV